MVASPNTDQFFGAIRSAIGFQPAREQADRLEAYPTGKQERFKGKGEG
jgi:hypothetical protein